MHIIGGSRKGKVARKEAKFAKYVALPLGMLHAKTLSPQNMLPCLLEGCSQRR